MINNAAEYDVHELIISKCFLYLRNDDWQKVSNGTMGSPVESIRLPLSCWTSEVISNDFAFDFDFFNGSTTNELGTRKVLVRRNSHVTIQKQVKQRKINKMKMTELVN